MVNTVKVAAGTSSEMSVAKTEASASENAAKSPANRAVLFRSSNQLEDAEKSDTTASGSEID